MAICRVFNYKFLSKFGKCCDKHKETTDEWNSAWVATLKCNYICAAFPLSIKKVLFENSFGNVYFFLIDMMQRLAIDCLFTIVYEHICNVDVAWKFLIKFIILLLEEMPMEYWVQNDMAQYENSYLSIWLTYFHVRSFVVAILLKLMKMIPELK